jgi:ketosteroid isomerase-like protein
MMNSNPESPPEPINVKWGEVPESSPREATAEFIHKLMRTIIQEDMQGLLNLFAPDGEWVIMATGERFQGPSRIRALTSLSVVMRAQGAGLEPEPAGVFADADGTKICLEYIYRGLVAKDWPKSAHPPVLGTPFEIPVTLIGEVYQGKLVKVREYFDWLTLTEAGAKNRL